MEVDEAAEPKFTEIKPSTSGQVLFPQESKFANIKNKAVRTKQYLKIKREKNKVFNFIVIS